METFEIFVGVVIGLFIVLWIHITILVGKNLAEVNGIKESMNDEIRGPRKTTSRRWRTIRKGG